ncbi:MAG: hypothetical protein RSE41_07175 [Clostridia bacterium]
MDKTRNDFKTDTEWYRYLATNEEKEEVKNTEIIDVYYTCVNCNFVKAIKVESSYIDDIVSQLKTGICPKCKHKGFKLIDAKEYKRIVKLNKSNKSNDKEKIYQNAVYAKNYILDEREKVFKDLTNKLKNKKISPERFVSLFYNICFDIMKRAAKNFNVPSFDWLSERKYILDMGQEVIELYNIKESQEDLLKNYDKEADEIYLEYRNVYEYERDEYKQDLRENRLNKKNYQRIGNKNILRETRLNDRAITKKEKSFKKELEKDVNRLK